MIKHRFITPPNLVLRREVVPELLQDAASPHALADALEALMKIQSHSTVTSSSCARRSVPRMRSIDARAYAVALADGGSAA